MRSTSIEYEKDIYYRGFHLTITVDAEAWFYSENYGEDMDGNRGTPMTFMDDFKLKVMDRNGNDITDKLRKREPSLFERVSDDAEQKLNEACE